MTSNMSKPCGSEWPERGLTCNAVNDWHAYWNGQRIHGNSKTRWADVDGRIIEFGFDNKPAPSAQRCPVCGSPPSAVDYVDVPHGEIMRKEVGQLHCPNDNDDVHLVARAHHAGQITTSPDA